MALDPKQRSSYRVPSIATLITLTMNQSSVDLLNCAAMLFVTQFRAYIRAKQIPLTVSVSSNIPTLAIAIPAAETRKRFERYLNGNPRSWHPSDLSTLNRFICFASRKRAVVRTPELAEFLQDKHGWSEYDSKRLSTHIDVGLAVLTEFRLRRDH
jgi:hypothetical protein